MKNIKFLILLIVALVGISVSTLAASPQMQKETKPVIFVSGSVTSPLHTEDVQILEFRQKFREQVSSFAHKSKYKPLLIKDYFGQPPEFVSLE